MNVEDRFTNLIKAANPKSVSNLPSLRFSLTEYFPDTPATKDPVVLLHSCCKSHCKIVPPSYWRKIASVVSSLGYKPVFTGNGADEAEFIRKIDPDNQYEHAVNRYSLWQLAKLMNRSALLVTVDTGIMHLAKYTGIKILTLCGGSNPDRIGPSEFFREENGGSEELSAINTSPTNTRREGICFESIRSDFSCPERTPHCLRLIPSYCLHWDGEYSGCMKAIDPDIVCNKIRNMLSRKERTYM